MIHRVRRWLLLAVVVLASTVVGAMAPSATTASAATYTYDASIPARVGAHELACAAASPAQLSDLPEGSASPPVQARGTATTPNARIVATNSVGNGMGGAGEMSMVRTVGRGEKIADLVDEGKRLTFETGNEYALVKLANGERAIVSGGPTGIALSDDVTRVFAHSHPYHLPATGPSAADFGMLSAFGQRSSWLLEHGTLSRFGVR